MAKTPTKKAKEARDRLKHPPQPLGQDAQGTLRFKENKLVRYILEKGGIDMNHLACHPFPREDRVQFAQLIGYSLGGFGELSYVTDEDYALAQIASAKGANLPDARVAALESVKADLEKKLRAIDDILGGGNEL